MSASRIAAPVAEQPSSEVSAAHSPSAETQPGQAAEKISPGLLLSVIIPVRNEEACIRGCLLSLVAQSESIFRLGRDWEIVVVDDGSSDRSRAIMEEFSRIPAEPLGIPAAPSGIPAEPLLDEPPSSTMETSGVTILDAPRLEKGWTGKANACWAGAQAASGEWLLFTDADTVHEPGNLRRAIFEAEKAKVGMLSYSPRQIASGFWQSALMPLIFSELALAYPPEKVSNPESRLAAANGQFLLVSRVGYRAIGGHAAVADSILEDVELAYLAKRRKVGLRFRYAADALSTRMYRSFREMIEGWTKNLALLFSNCLATAAWKMLDLALLAGLPLLVLAFWHQPISRWAFLLLWARTLWRFYNRVGKSNFSALDCAISVFALPLFAALLWRSWFHHTVRKRVVWKGRLYPG